MEYAQTIMKLLLVLLLLVMLSSTFRCSQLTQNKDEHVRARKRRQTPDLLSDPINSLLTGALSSGLSGGALTNLFPGGSANGSDQNMMKIGLSIMNVISPGSGNEDTPLAQRSYIDMAKAMMKFGKILQADGSLNLANLTETMNKIKKQLNPKVIYDNVKKLTEKSAFTKRTIGFQSDLISDAVAGRVKFVNCTQSTTEPKGECQNAIDGIISCQKASCTTREVGSWFEAHFDSYIYLYRIRIIKHSDPELFNTKYTILLTKNFQCAEGLMNFDEKSFSCEKETNKVKIMLHGYGKLKMCEIIPLKQSIMTAFLNFMGKDAKETILSGIRSAIAVAYKVESAFEKNGDLQSVKFKSCIQSSDESPSTKCQHAMDGQFACNPASHTKAEETPWWQGVFSKTLTVHFVYLIMDNKYNALFKVTSSKGEMCGRKIPLNIMNITLACTIKTKSITVTVIKATKNIPLRLCEVTAMVDRQQEMKDSLGLPWYWWVMIGVGILLLVSGVTGTLIWMFMSSKTRKIIKEKKKTRKKAAKTRKSRSEASTETASSTESFEIPDYEDTDEQKHH